MIITSDQLLFENKLYKDPHHKIQSLVKKGDLIPLKRGMYETDAKLPGYVLANEIMGPSYLSFEYALSYYGMIPERVRTYTSATFDKKKRIEFKNQFGIYSYRDIPKQVFPFFYTREIFADRSYLIATREKALCDQLCVEHPIRGLKDFEEYLFDGMRLDEDIFEELDFERIRRIAPLYHRTNLDQLVKLIGKGDFSNE